MNRALRIAAAAFGVFAGIGGVEHGYFEMLQGHVKPAGLMIESIGPPCQPELVWNACEPAMTVIPSFIITGILAIIFGAITIIWSLAFVHKKHGALVLILLSVVLLLVGGGIFPPVIGIVGGLIATRIYMPLTWWRARSPGGPLRLLANLWPWSPIVLFVWMLGQWVIGALAPELMLSLACVNVILILVLLAVTVLAAFAYDVKENDPTVAA